VSVIVLLSLDIKSIYFINCYNITEILLKVALSTINLNLLKYFIIAKSEHFY